MDEADEIGLPQDGPRDSVATELLAKHRRSNQPESQQICVVLGAILEVLDGEGMEATPTALFAAIMSSLQGARGSSGQSQQPSQVCAAMTTILAATLSRVPEAVLRSKFAASSEILCCLAEEHAEQASTLKPVLSCLATVTAAVDPREWASAVRPFGLLLGLSLDERPKVRKRAQEGIIDVLAAVQGTPAADSAAASVLRVCQQVLPGPEVAARAAAAASSKKRAEAEAAITKAVTDALRLLGWLKLALPLMPGAKAQEAVGLMLKLYVLRQPMLSRSATECLTALCMGSSTLSAAALVELLRNVVHMESAWDAKDPASLIPLIGLVEAGYVRLHELDATAGTERLPHAFHAIVPQLTAALEGVRFAAEQALKRLVADCLDDAAVAAAVNLAGAGMGASAGPPSAAAAVVASVAGALDLRSQDAWPSALSVSAVLFERLGHRGAALAEPLLERVGELCAAAAEAAEAADQDDDEGGAVGVEYAGAAAAAMSAALRHLGPENVLRALPLNLEEGLEGRGEARTWLLPMLRQHVSNARLGFWGSVLLPLARRMGSTAANPAHPHALACRALEAQLWNCLPSFASWPEDTATAFQAHAKEMAMAFISREDLRTPICTALYRLCTQNRDVLKTAGQAEGLGFSEQPSAPTQGDDSDAEEEGPGVSSEAPASYTPEVARQNVMVLRGFSKNWLKVLADAFVATPSGMRGPIVSAISAYAAISDPAVLTSFLKDALGKYVELTQAAHADVPPASAVQGGGSTLSEQRCTFLELALALAGGLKTDCIKLLFTTAKGAMQERDQAVQKRAYKLLAYITARRRDFTLPNLRDVLETLLTGVTSSLSAAKRYRLACLQAAVLLLLSPDAPAVDLRSEDDAGMSEEEQRKQVVATLVSEIVLCVKEVNQKTRAAAYGLLVDLGQAMHEADPPSLPSLDTHMGGLDLKGGSASGSGGGGLATLFDMVLGGLVGTSPHMISASVMALARLLHQFSTQLGGVAPTLLPAVLMLLRTKSREVVKSVLGFVKVCAMRLPVDVLEQHMAQILEGLLLWSEDSKNKFRLKVRVIVERLARRCGYDAVAGAMPPGDKRLLIHIRRENLRKQRLRADETGSQMDADEEDDVRSRMKGARTARGSTWNHTKVFSEAGSEGAPTKAGRALSKRSGPAAGPRGQMRSGQSTKQGESRAMLASSANGDPMDLLDAGASRQLQRAAAAKPRRSADDFARGNDGKMIIRDDDAPPGGKRKRRAGGGFDDRLSDDSDFDDLRHIGGLAAGMRSASAKSVALAQTVATNTKTARTSRPGGGSARSVGGRSVGGRTSATAKGRQHSGDRFKSKGKAGGDQKGSSRVEPYAYWPLDRKMLNRRPSKKKEAQEGLDQMVRAAKSGAARGNKAKRQRAK
ncbi:RRP12-like protein [Coccomyxa sp. Obi]|nr:RRP12-like protein [Coccomyxa sp. Obi]